MIYYDIILIRWTFFSPCFSGVIHEFKNTTKYLFTLLILHIIWNPQIQVSRNMFIVVKPWNFMSIKLDDFTVTIYISLYTNMWFSGGHKAEWCSYSVPSSSQKPKKWASRNIWLPWSKWWDARLLFYVTNCLSYIKKIMFLT